MHTETMINFPTKDGTDFPGKPAEVPREALADLIWLLERPGLIYDVQRVSPE